MPLSDSSGTYMRAVRPKPPPAVLLLVGSRRLRGLPVLVHEASRRVWGLRLRRTDQELALALLLILPTAHYKDGGVRIASFVGSRTGAVLRRFSLAVAPRFLWECLNIQTVSWFPAPATSNVACGFPALRSPVCFTSRVIRPLDRNNFRECWPSHPIVAV